MPTIRKYFVVCLLTLSAIKTQAQYCSNALDTVYGLTSSGRICPINVNTATGAPSPNRDSTGTGLNANGLGFSSLNGSFYFFNRCNAGPGSSVDSTQFVRYIPSTRTTQILADPPATLTTAQKIRSGCMNTDGSGYYSINPGATGGAALYYYSVGTGLWTTITQTFKNKSGVTIANIVSLNSGDMAFDGSGNLWILSSSSANYTLYKVTAPIPTVVTANLVVDTIIAQQATPNAASFTGIAFNSAGKLYLSTGAGVAAGNNKLYELATATGALTLKGTLLAGYGDDLTSCSYPPGVLPVVWVNFSTAFQTGAIQLRWTVNETEDVTGYNIEYSSDREHWQTVAHIIKDNFNAGLLKTYSYIDNGYKPGNNYYRIVQLSSSGTKSVSATKLISTGATNKIYIGPNPAKDVIYLYNKDNSFKLLAQVFDKNGSLIYSTVVIPDQQSINISQIPRGSYVLRLLSGATNENYSGYQFIKW